MVFEINGINIVPFIAYNGLSMSREDVDGPDAGRDLSADMHRARVATKYRWDVTCRPLTSKELGIVLRTIKPEWVTVKYYDPELEQIVAHTMYSNNGKVSYQQRYKNGIEYWSGITFPVIDK